MPKTLKDKAKIRKQFDVDEEYQKLINSLVKATKSTSEAEAFRKAFRIALNLLQKVESGSEIFMQKHGEITSLEFIL